MSLAILLLLDLLLLLLLDFLGAALAVCLLISHQFVYGIFKPPASCCGYACEGQGFDADVRRADSLPEERTIDCENAARRVKANGARRVAKARIADMLASLKVVVVWRVVVFAGFRCYSSEL